MPAIHQHFRLDDRHEARLLRQRREASQSVRVHPDAVLARDVSADRDDRAPFGEACSELAVLREALAQAVETLRDLLAGGEREGFRALVDLDPGDDPLSLEHLRERCPIRCTLADRLVEQYDPADPLACVRGGEEEFPISPPALLRRLDTDCRKAPLDSYVALVGSEDALTGRDQRSHCLCNIDGACHSDFRGYAR